MTEKSDAVTTRPRVAVGIAVALGGAHLVLSQTSPGILGRVDEVVTIALLPSSLLLPVASLLGPMLNYMLASILGWENVSLEQSESIRFLVLNATDSLALTLAILIQYTLLSFIAARLWRRAPGRLARERVEQP